MEKDKSNAREIKEIKEITSVTIIVCFNCHSHSFSTRHNPDKFEVVN